VLPIYHRGEKKKKEKKEMKAQSEDKHKKDTYSSSFSAHEVILYNPSLLQPSNAATD
jgi:hypothetical protein